VPNQSSNVAELTLDGMVAEVISARTGPRNALPAFAAARPIVSVMFKTTIASATVILAAAPPGGCGPAAQAAAPEPTGCYRLNAMGAIAEPPTLFNDRWVYAFPYSWGRHNVRPYRLTRSGPAPEVTRRALRSRSYLSAVSTQRNAQPVGWASSVLGRRYFKVLWIAP
jgi:hypothetical protein